MSQTYNISSQEFDSLITINNKGIVTGATSPLEKFEGYKWWEVKARAAKANISIYNERDTLELMKENNNNLVKLIDRFDLKEID